MQLICTFVLAYAKSRVSHDRDAIKRVNDLRISCKCSNFPQVHNLNFTKAAKDKKV